MEISPEMYNKLSKLEQCIRWTSGRSLLNKMIERAEIEAEYRALFVEAFAKFNYMKLRELSIPFDGGYWKCRDIANAVDGIGSGFCKFETKYGHR